MVKPEKIRLGISSCLLGEKVRYDGGHKLDLHLIDALGPYVDWVPVCPEVGMGLPVPRERMHLMGDPAAPRLVTSFSRVDLTDDMKCWTRRQLRELKTEGLCGFIFKSGSPSSGMARIEVYNETGAPRAVSSGLWARAFMDANPLMPVEDDDHLRDHDRRENFIERVIVFHRCQ